MYVVGFCSPGLPRRICQWIEALSNSQTQQLQAGMALYCIQEAVHKPFNSKVQIKLNFIMSPTVNIEMLRQKFNFVDIFITFAFGDIKGNLAGVNRF